ncbi:hypothetical protein [Cernens ardua]|uniref:hypothetical protein n=1 Tax=Cernens ardua TaxID=3402176 RepID=UPI003F9BBF7B
MFQYSCDHTPITSPTGTAISLAPLFLHHHSFFTITRSSALLDLSLPLCRDRIFNNAILSVSFITFTSEAIISAKQLSLYNHYSFLRNRDNGSVSCSASAIAGRHGDRYYLWLYWSRRCIAHGFNSQVFSVRVGRTWSCLP